MYEVYSKRLQTRMSDAHAVANTTERRKRVDALKVEKKYLDALFIEASRCISDRPGSENAFKTIEQTLTPAELQQARILQEQIFNDRKILLEVGPDNGEPSNYWAASPDQIKNAPCSNQKAATDDEMDAWLRQHAKTTSAVMSKNIHGFQIEEENKEVMRLFETLVTYVSPFALEATVKADVLKHQKQFQSMCRKVECALREVFGDRQGRRLMYLLARYGFNASHLSKKDSTPFNEQEWESILSGIADLPEDWFPINPKEAKSLTRYERGSKRAIYGTLDVTGNAAIEFFDKWNRLDPMTAKAAVVHEIAHNIADSRLHPDSIEWMQCSHWKEVGDYKFESGKPSKFVSTYAAQTPDEDAAESIVAYRYNPSELLQRAPDKYKLIKDKVFLGREYLSKKDCGP